MACISASERSSLFKRASVARKYFRKLWRYSDIERCNGGSGNDMMITASSRRRGPFGVQPRNTQAHPVLPSRTGERRVYSLLPEDSHENGDIPEPPCETREKKSPFD